jgi:hypothetical protein
LDLDAKRLTMIGKGRMPRLSPTGPAAEGQ